MPVPNLPKLGAAQLYEFAERHAHGRNAADILPASITLRVRYVAELARYAHCLLSAKLCRQRGDVPQALVYEGLAEGFLKHVPREARW